MRALYSHIRRKARAAKAALGHSYLAGNNTMAGWADAVGLSAVGDVGRGWSRETVGMIPETALGVGLTGVSLFAGVRAPVVGEVEILGQTDGVGGMRFLRTEGLDTHTSMAALRATGALPGEQGVILTDRVVNFGDVYSLGTLGGRKVEFSLVTEQVDGQLVKKLYSGDAWTSPVPRDARLVGHVHPNENQFQLWPSTQDMNMVNARYFRELQVNPSAQAAPTRIF